MHMDALLQLLTPLPFLCLVLGVLIGLVVGSIPGLNDTITLAVLVPVTFSMPSELAFPLLVGIYCSACFGGSFPAILLKIPGTASSVLTALDGHAMAQRGEAARALGIATYSSAFGGVVSALLLLLFAPVLASWALRFGPTEYFALCLLGLSTVIGMARGNVIRSTIACAFGLLVATVGLSPQAGVPRFDFDIPWLLEGLPLTPVLIGLFGITSVLELVGTKTEAAAPEAPAKRVPMRDMLLPRALCRRLLPVWANSSLIGCVIGILPGAGMLMAIYLAYNRVVRRFRDQVGKGLPEGVAAPEAANNAVVSSSMVPLLSLGIPGNSTAALFLGALMIHGMRPGPSLFVESGDIAYLVVFAFVVGNLLMFPMGLALGGVLPALLGRIPRGALISGILVTCLTGAYAVGNSSFGVWVALAFGAIGFLFSVTRVPISPFVLALVLEPMLERALYQSLALSGGSPWIFLQHPITVVLLGATVLFLVWPLLQPLVGAAGRRRATTRPAARAATEHL